ncbi:DUF58 domain-containing protein [Rurimicrobium arvi]|uniref:DUF58 domain-containing protein n=1 Tax=Rurimicrobium arvi TaxID=2049916 RepID=A0ABP8MLY0_9BACT
MEIKPTAETLELIARQAVEGFIIGLHKSPFHGFSVEFAEHRQYNPGDDLRHIDWRVYGRSERFFIKKHEEETNLRCCILLDTSSSMQFPDGGRWNKLQYGCLVAASLLQLLKRQLDATSLALFDESVYFTTECRSAGTHYRRLQQELARVFALEEKMRPSNIAQAIHQIADQVHRRSLVVVISDMVETQEELNDLFDALQHLRYNKHEVILVQVLSRKEEIEFAFENRPYEFVDLETGLHTRLQAGDLKDQYRRAMNEFRVAIENQCYKYNISRVEVDLEAPVDEVLHAFLLKRNKMQ